MIYAPQDDFLRLFQAINATRPENPILFRSKGGILRAVCPGPLPTINLVVGGMSFPLEEDALRWKQEQGNWVLSIVGFNIDEEDPDMGHLSNSWVLGCPLLQSAVLIFDRRNVRVGFSHYI